MLKVAIDSINNMDKLNLAQKANRIQKVSDLVNTFDREENAVEVFVKTEPLMGQRICRIIAAGIPHLRDLTHIVNVYVQPKLYKLNTFIKGDSIEIITQKLLKMKSTGRRAYMTDFSAYDSTQSFYCNKMQSEILKSCGAPLEVQNLWDSVIKADNTIMHKDFKMYTSACKLSGVKSTSWSNTLLTHLFV